MVLIEMYHAFMNEFKPLVAYNALISIFFHYGQMFFFKMLRPLKRVFEIRVAEITAPIIHVVLNKECWKTR